MGQTFHVEAMLGANASQFDAVMQASKGKVEDLGKSAKGAGAGFMNMTRDLMAARTEVEALGKVANQFFGMIKGGGVGIVAGGAIASIANYREEVRKANEELAIQLTKRGELARLSTMTGAAKDIASMRIGHKADIASVINNTGLWDRAMEEMFGTQSAKLKALRVTQKVEESGAIVGKNIEAGATAATMENTIRYGELESQILLRNWSINREINDARKQGLDYLAEQLERQKAAQGIFDEQARARHSIGIKQTDSEMVAVTKRAAGGSQDEMDLAILNSKLKAHRELWNALTEEKDKAAAMLVVAQTQLAIEEKRIAIAERLASLAERQANARSTKEGYSKQWEESQNRLDRLNKMLENPNLSKEKRAELETQREEENQNRRKLQRDQTREHMGIFQEAGGAYLQNRLMRSGASQYERANAEEDWNMKSLRERMQFETDPTAKARIGAQLMGAQQSALERLQGVAPIGDSLARSGGGGNIAAAPDTGKRQIEIQQSMDATLKLILQSLTGGIPGSGNSFVLPPAVN